jgi:ATP-binding cassette, subfamily B, bacterial PglK
VSLIKMLGLLYGSLPKERHRQFKALVVLIFISSFAEVISLGAVLPFMAVITQPDEVLRYSIVALFAESFGINSGKELIIPLSIVFGLAAILSGVLRLLLLRASIRLGNNCGADLSVEIYRRTLYQPYSVHISQSTSEIITSITQKVGAVTSVLTSVVILIASLFLFLSIVGTLIAVDPIIAISAAIVFGFAYVTIGWATKKKLKENSLVIAREQNFVVKALQEGLGSIRDVLIAGTQELYISLYDESVNKIRHSTSQNTFINQFPRYAIEALGLVSIAAFVLYLNNNGGNVTNSLGLIAILALGAQRLLPITQQIYGNWSLVLGNQYAIADVLKLLNQPLISQNSKHDEDKLMFNESIKFQNVSFTYSKNYKPVFDGISLSIPKGSRVGIVGSTGGGKSTLLDLLMGLLDPSEGKIYVDGKDVSLRKFKRLWQSSIAHVPQNIFLTDATIAENIAFGVPLDKIKMADVKKAAKYAKISDFIESSPDGYSANVGERGVRLSGGQRQRIGIARALYREADVIVFDEATSALDDKTEDAVMHTINNLSQNITMFIVAHRLTTLKKCDFIVKLDSGEVIGTYDYNQIIEMNEIS